MHRITMVGTGYVGLVSGACFAEFGNEVTCVDADREKIEQLRRGEIPFHEFGLEEIVERNVEEERLSFSTDLARAIKNGDVIFICVGTPRGSDGDLNLQYVFQVVRDIARHINGYKVIVQKSTVPVGTGARIRDLLHSQRNGNHDFDVASNPEFLREGSAVEDFMRPDRVVIGTWNEKAADVLTEIYRPLTLNDVPLLKTTVETAELIKYAANAFLATKISFINEIANLCELVGADVKILERGLGLDRRIGSEFLHSGAGYGGSCFPKDTEALDHLARSLGHPLRIVRATIEVNDEQRKSLMARTERVLGGVAGKRLAILGLSFKPETDDIRDAVSLDFMRFLREKGAEVLAYDPVAVPNARRAFEDATYTEDVWAAVTGADAVIVAVEWNEFRTLNLKRLRECMRGNVVVDLRNIYEPAGMRDMGFLHVGVGRGTPPERPSGSSDPRR
jgi:UDPglucose 6-dehydrogenase